MSRFAKRRAMAECRACAIDIARVNGGVGLPPVLLGLALFHEVLAGLKGFSYAATKFAAAPFIRSSLNSRELIPTEGLKA